MKKRNTFFYLLIPSLFFAGCTAIPPKPVGTVDGQLFHCPPAPKCVSSYYKKGLHHIDPLFYQGSQEAAHKRLLHVLRNYPHVTLVTIEPNYIHAQANNPPFNWVDDIEFLFDDKNKTIHYSSSANAKIGFFDMGKNKRRARVISELFYE